MSLNGFDIRISWLQFREVSSRPAGVNENAEIITDSHLGFRTRTDNGIIEIIDVNTTISVSRARSWVMANSKSNLLLNHEQGHFDIIALGMREVYKRLLSVSGTKSSEFNKEVEIIRSSVQRKIDDKNHLYDRQTNHGMNVAEQQGWSSKIQSLKGVSSGKLDDLR